ncbi:MAG: ferritin [Treponema sp.]|nr:ferritin [Treponema sp.]
MMKENLVKALSDQVNAEYYSAYLYLSMSAYAENATLKGTANWLHVQAQEELAHGMRMYQYILEHGMHPALGAIKAPPATYTGVEDIYKKIVAHEQKVTESINNIATLAMKEHDHACYQFLMWFVNEQVEEEANANDILNKVQMIGDNKGLLLTLDSELAARTFVNPFPAAVN